MPETLDLLIVGAGPAGLAAYQTARDCGMHAALVDESREPGGRIYRGVTQARDAGRALDQIYGPDGAWAAASIDAVRADGAYVLVGHSVLDVTRNEDGNWVLHLMADTGLTRLSARRILVATGARERPFAFPGWTLPGVMTAGAIQTLMKGSNCLPDCPVILAGSGPLLLLLTTQLIEKGVTVSALIDTTPRGNRQQAARHLPGALVAGTSLWQGMRLLARIQQAGVPHYRNATRIAAEGSDRVSGVRFTHPGGEQQLSTSLLITHLGIVPDTQLTRLLGCAHLYSPLLQAWQPDVDAVGQTTNAGISAAGDATGSNGALAARNAGHLAALDAAAKLNAISSRARDCAAKPLLDRHRRLSRERRFLNHYFAPGRISTDSQPDATLLCRCEEVSFGTLREMSRSGVTSFDHFKAVTRCGMGLCQGRMCADLATMALADVAGTAPDSFPQMKVRAPLKPVPMRSIANGVDTSTPLPGDEFVYTSEKA